MTDTLRRKTFLLTFLCTLGLTASCGQEPETIQVTPLGADNIFKSEPMYITGAFDGSKRFGMWIDTMDFARRIKREFGKSLHFTYFINSCYYDHTTRGSAIGRSHSKEEDIVRMSLTQQAINEGHEIGNHSVLHKDGSQWGVGRWRSEFEKFDEVISAGLFEPIYDSEGKTVFPNWQATASNGDTGASCLSDNECGSGECLMVTESDGFCSQGCNGNLECPNNTVCGAPDWHTTQDRCIPMPSFPVYHNGEELFDIDGKANLSHPDLRPYKIVGFRAPQLGRNKAMYEVLKEKQFLYDTSDAITNGIRMPYRARKDGVIFPSIYQFGLMKNHGAKTIPMDYNYKYNDVSGERMLKDYKKSIVDTYNDYGRVPWNMGHHFALWKDGAYWRAMQDTFVFAAQGCPNQIGEMQCEQVFFPSFAELTQSIGRLSDASERTDGDDPFLLPDYEPTESSIGSSLQECHCKEEHYHER